MTTHEHIASEIIKYQSALIGPVAIELAKKTQGIIVTGHTQIVVEITGNPKKVIDDLIGTCIHIWGKLGILQCKEAAKKFIPLLKDNELPERLE